MSAQTPATVSIYMAVLAHEYPRGLPAIVVLDDAPVPLPAMSGSDATWLRGEESVPEELRRAAGAGAEGAVRFAPRVLPSQIRLMSRGDILALFNDGIEHGWRAFRRVTGADRWHAFSNVILTNDQTTALVYHEQRCGGLCGEGAFVWLQRESMESPWRVRQRIITWVS